MHRRKILLVERFGVLAVFLAENIIAVALHRLTAVSAGNALVLCFLCNRVRHFLRRQTECVSACLRVLLQRPHESLLLLRQLIHVHNGRRIVRLRELVRCTVEQRTLQ